MSFKIPVSYDEIFDDYLLTTYDWLNDDDDAPELLRDQSDPLVDLFWANFPRAMKLANERDNKNAYTYAQPVVEYIPLSEIVADHSNEEQLGFDLTNVGKEIDQFAINEERNMINLDTYYGDISMCEEETNYPM